jgi:N-acetylmuramoyl-L-alanine amidase
MRAYRRGDCGPAVAEIRDKLVRLGLLQAAAAACTDVFDQFDQACDRAVREFQQSRGLSVDGLVGRETYRALDEARWRLGDRLLYHRVSHPYVGDDVADLQVRLLDMGFDPGRCDGVFGAGTANALREFQRNVGLGPDGTCGPATLKALTRLARTVVGGSPESMRETERLRGTGPALTGKLVVLDPGHGGSDRGSEAGDLDETSIVEDLAFRLEGRLAATGMQVALTRGPGVSPTDAERAAFANGIDADLVLSLHVDSAPSPRCCGVATYYFGSPGGTTVAPWRGQAQEGNGQRRTGSVLGERLASLVQREVVARTDLLDCRTHPKTWELLRRTGMPAVRLELGYLSSPRDAARLRSPQFRDVVAEALVVAVQRLYLPQEADAQTGQLRLPALLS